MDSASAVERFCYLGTLKPVYVAKVTKIDWENYAEYSKLVESINGDQFVKIIRLCLERNNLPRKDELWYIYAIYMASSTKQDNKKLAGSEFANLALTSDDLFTFAYFAKKLRESDSKKGFSNSVRRAIGNWYEKQNVDRFIGSVTKNVGLHGFTHRDLVSLCHVNTSENDLDDVLQYVGPKRTKLDDTKKVKESESFKALRDIYKFKKSGDNTLMKRLIDEKKLEFDTIPTTQRNKIETWELILPIMTYHQLMDNLYYLVEKKFFENSDFNRLYLEALDNHDAMIKENIHPLSFLYLKNRLDKQIRYSENVKQSYHSKTPSALQMKPNKNLNAKLSTLFNKSFDNYRGPPISTLVSINIAEKFKRQSVISQTQVNCYEAAITLALSFYKSEKPSSVHAFSTGKMKKIEWKKCWNYVEASEYCTPYVTSKVMQRLAMPIYDALNSKNDFVDLFLIIVGSATFGNPNNKPDQLIEILQEYREKKNANAKVVIVNLRRFRSAMEYEPLQSNGILEICGINDNALKIISAFALNHFN